MTTTGPATGPAREPSAGPSGPSAGQEIWPFAITRSVMTGFRIVVAPDFLVDVGQHHLLGDIAGGDVSEEHAYLREYRDRGSVGLWLLYRIVYLAKEDVGGDDSFDAQNRRTPLIEGVVCRTRPQVDATGELFAAVHELCRPAVRDFYTEDLETFPVRRRESLKAPMSPVSGDVLPVVRKNPYVSERNLQVALRGHHPRPLREPAPTVRTSVPAGSAGLDGAGGAHGRGRGALGDGQGGEGGRRRPAQGPGRDGGAVVGRPAGPVRTVVVAVGAAGLLVLVLLVLLLAGVFG